MIDIKNKISLKKYNSFGVEATAERLVHIHEEKDIIEFLELGYFNTVRLLILGEGSNILFTNNFDGIIIKIYSKGIRIYDENDEEVIIESEAGELWDDLVKYCVDKNYYGVENLSLIPGTVGAAPVQNIGAYGVELKDVFHSLVGYNLSTAEKMELKKDDCRFGYRESIFKSEYSNTFIITSVRLKLSKKGKINLAYKALKNIFTNTLEDEITLNKIRDEVIKIRLGKLPDYKILGNAGSFFKNPEIDSSSYQILKNNYPEVVAFTNNDRFKISAAWLIEKCGFKGKRIGNVGCHENQALVIVNYGGATGSEILNHAKLVQNAVLNKFKIKIEFEVNII